MPFNKKAFMAAKFVAREETVSVPDMKEWFMPSGDTPVWRVRGLTGQELARVHASVEKNRNVVALLEGLASGAEKEKVEAMKDLLGLGEKVPDDLAKRLEMCVLGSVEPKCDLDLALRLCRNFPIEFYTITNTITTLTGMGHTVGKQKPSGGTRGSGTPSPLPKPEGASSTN